MTNLEKTLLTILLLLLIAFIYIGASWFTQKVEIEEKKSLSFNSSQYE